MWVWIFSGIAATAIVSLVAWFVLRRTGRVGLNAWSNTMICAENERAAEYAEYPGSTARTL
jgi:hypothetical protein